MFPFYFMFFGFLYLTYITNDGFEHAEVKQFFLT